MSSKDNSYSQLTKRLRSKNNAAFYKNTIQNPVNLFNTGVGDITNGWINALVTGRKDVYNTSDLGYQNADNSCVCAAAAPAPAPVPPPINPQSIVLMAAGSVYTVTQESGVFKTTSDPGNLTKNYLEGLPSAIIPYILEVEDTYAYVVGTSSVNISTSLVFAINKITGATVQTLTFTNSFVTGVTEIGGYLYVNYVTVASAEPIIVNSFIDVFDINNSFTVITHFDLSTPFEGGETIVLSQVVQTQGEYYAFAYYKTGDGSDPGTINYDIYAIRFTTFDISDTPILTQKLNTDTQTVILGSLLSELNKLAIFRPTVLINNIVEGIDAVVIPQLNGGISSENGLYAYKVFYGEGFGYSSYLIDASLTTLNPVPISSFINIGTYLYCTAGSYITGSKIYVIPTDFTSVEIVIPSPLSYLNASDYIFTSDGTSIFRWQKNDSSVYSIEKYAATGDLSTPAVSTTIEVPLTTTNLNIVYDFTASKLFANPASGTINEINTTTLVPSPTNFIYVV